MKNLLLALLALTTLNNGFSQNKKPFSEDQKKDMRDKVVEACRHAWQGYKDHAWGFDDLQPLPVCISTCVRNQPSGLRLIKYFLMADW